MSSITTANFGTISPNTTPLTSTTLKLTRRGRLVFTTLFLLVLASAMILIGGRAVASLDAGTPQQVRYVEVTSGDTLYSIAGEYAEPGHVRELVQQIQEVNSMPTSTLQEGQRIAIPVD